mgnify:CR=1 FL=1
MKPTTPRNTAPSKLSRLKPHLKNKGTRDPKKTLVAKKVAHGA